MIELPTGSFLRAENKNHAGSLDLFSITGSPIEHYVVGPSDMDEDAYRLNPSRFKVYDNFDEAESAYLDSEDTEVSLYGVLEECETLTMIR